MGTVHWSKGLEADDVYILQPNTLPLAERIALGGWQKYEELCIQVCSTLNPNPSNQLTTQLITSNLLLHPDLASSSPSPARARA